VIKSLTIEMLLTYAEPIVCALALVVMWRKKQFSQFRALSLFLSARLITMLICIPLLRLGGKQITLHASYLAYFYIYWFSYAVEAVLGLGMVYEVYKLAMAPLRGLQALGMLMFRWAAGIAVAVAMGMALGPHMTGQRFVIRAITQLEQTQSILTLCLLIFVCLAVRPMGLSHRSRIFGVSLGLGLLATAELIDSAWISHAPDLASTFNIVNSILYCATVLIWTCYFALPEPRRRMIVLPTTSPFLRWNQISMALGDEPGFVAVGGVHPDIFAPAELEIMRRASLKMNASSIYS
jgi:hypothetical protein